MILNFIDIKIQVVQFQKLVRKVNTVAAKMECHLLLMRKWLVVHKPIAMKHSLGAAQTTKLPQKAMIMRDALHQHPHVSNLNMVAVMIIALSLKDQIRKDVKNLQLQHLK